MEDRLSARVERVHARMTKAGFDALVASSPANVRYLTGFGLGMESLTLHAGGHVLMAVVLCQDPQPCLVAPATDVVPAVLQGVPARLITYGRNTLVVHRRDDVGEGYESAVRAALRTESSAPTAVQAVVSILADAGARCVGIDDGGMPASVHLALTRSFGRAEFVSATALLRAVRAVKEPEEVACLRQGAQIVEAAIEEVWRGAQPGISEVELATRALHTMIDHGARPTLWYVGVGDQSALVDRLPTNRTITRGDVIMVDFGCEYRGYYADLARTAVLGSPSPRLAGYYAAVQEGERAALAAVRTGQSATTVFRQAVSAVRASGIPHFDRVHCGHGIGLEPYDDPLLSAGSDGLLESGMVLNVETPYYELGFAGLQLEDTVLVTDTGPDFLSRLPRELMIL
jgi:Xaa-Pro dipeptidase